jgi:hypothetical protein
MQRSEPGAGLRAPDPGGAVRARSHDQAAVGAELRIGDRALVPVAAASDASAAHGEKVRSQEERDIASRARTLLFPAVPVPVPEEWSPAVLYK